LETRVRENAKIVTLAGKEKEEKRRGKRNYDHFFSETITAQMKFFGVSKIFP